MDLPIKCRFRKSTAIIDCWIGLGCWKDPETWFESRTVSVVILHFMEDHWEYEVANFWCWMPIWKKGTEMQVHTCVCQVRALPRPRGKINPQVSGAWNNEAAWEMVRTSFSSSNGRMPQTEDRRLPMAWPWIICNQEDLGPSAAAGCETSGGWNNCTKGALDAIENSNTTD